MFNLFDSSAIFRPNWIGFLILALVVAGSLYGAFRIQRLVFASRNAPPVPSEYEGIRGWLILVLIGLVSRAFVYAKTAVSASIILCDKTRWDNLTVSGTPNYDPYWAPSLIFEACGASIFVVTAILAFVLMFQKKFTFPYVMIGLSLGSIFFHLIDHTLASQITVISHNDRAFLVLIFKLTVAAVIWIPYFLISKRVKATFRY